MKLNWGWSIVIALSLFAIFIGYFFVRGLQQTTDLVREDYYDHEIKFQQQIDDKARAKELGNIRLESIDGKMAIVFPEGFKGEKAVGRIQLYKPDNAKFDQEIPLSLDANNAHLLETEDLIRGRWDIKINAKVDDVGYYWEESINL